MDKADIITANSDTGLTLPSRVFLCGGDGFGWALDDLLNQTKHSLQNFQGLMRFTGLEDSDVIHSVSTDYLADLQSQKITGKRIICNLDNDVFQLLKSPGMLKAFERVGLWLAPNQLSFYWLNKIGKHAQYMPNTILPTTFTPRPIAEEVIDSMKSKYNLPKGKFIIGNFMRDTEGASFSGGALLPKLQKGPDLFLSIAEILHKKGLPIHILLIGPRRHWLRGELDMRGIPYTFLGTTTKRDDIHINTVDHGMLNEAFHMLDLYAVTSRWEGGPFSTLEAVATHCKVISSRVGLSPDILEPECIFDNVEQAVASIEREIRAPFLKNTVGIHYERLLKNFTPEANVLRFLQIYKDISKVPIYQPKKSVSCSMLDKALLRKDSLVNKILRRMPTAVKKSYFFGRKVRVGFWHEYHRPPYGGGNQFMLALRKAFESKGINVVDNRLGRDIDVYICNSAWFDVKKFYEYSRRFPIKMIHRIDGPVALYRGTDREMDDKIFDLNARFASATVLQSVWTMKNLIEMGYRPVEPVVIGNSVDPEYFHSNGRIKFSTDRKIRLISTSWSHNTRKGGPVYKWIEDNLDWGRFEYTFVGNSSEKFSKIKHIKPVHSRHLGKILREHDIYITASQNDPCSNALIEALACGLPALYLDSGGHKENVGYGGIPFSDKEELLSRLDCLVCNYELFKNLVRVPSISAIAEKYLELVRFMIT